MIGVTTQRPAEGFFYQKRSAPHSGPYSGKFLPRTGGGVARETVSSAQSLGVQGQVPSIPQDPHLYRLWNTHSVLFKGPRRVVASCTQTELHPEHQKGQDQLQEKGGKERRISSVVLGPLSKGAMRRQCSQSKMAHAASRSVCQKYVLHMEDFLRKKRHENEALRMCSQVPSSSPHPQEPQFQMGFERCPQLLHLSYLRSWESLMVMPTDKWRYDWASRGSQQCGHTSAAKLQCECSSLKGTGFHVRSMTLRWKV